MSAAKHLRPTDRQLPRGPATRPPRPLSPVVYAQPKDLEDLIWFLRSVRDEIDAGRVDDDMMVALAERLANCQGGVALIVRGTYGVEASLGMKFDQPELSHATFLRVTWNVVAPEARQSTGHARSMLIHARGFADSIRLPIMIEEYSPNLEAGKMKLIARHMKTAGAVFLHDPENAETTI